MMMGKWALRPFQMLLLLVFVMVDYGDAAHAAYRQGTSITQNSTPSMISNVICTQNYTSIVDGVVTASPGFCPVSGQTGYSITMNFNTDQTEYATRLVVWANAGVVFNDSELRIFNLTITYTDPVTLGTLTYTKTNATIVDTIDAATPVFHNFTDAGGNPIRLYGIKTVTMGNLRVDPAMTATSEAAFREVQIDVYTDPAAENLQLSKTSRIFDETTGPRFLIPQNDVTYRITATNAGTSGIDSNSIFLVDPLPSQLTFFNGDANGSLAGTSSIVVTANTSGGLTFPAAAFGYATTAPANFAACNYTPVAGYDPAVKYICIRPTGTFYGSTGSPNPAFTIEFRARIN